jgi:hypothetical protein
LVEVHDGRKEHFQVTDFYGLFSRLFSISVLFSGEMVPYLGNHGPS